MLRGSRELRFPLKPASPWRGFPSSKECVKETPDLLSTVERLMQQLQVRNSPDLLCFSQNPIVQCAAYADAAMSLLALTQPVTDTWLSLLWKRAARCFESASFVLLLLDTCMCAAHIPFFAFV